MTPEFAELLKSFVLASCVAAGDTGLPETILLQQARLQVHKDITLPDLKSEVREQADKGWITSYAPAVGPQRWRITNFGGSVARELGLA